MSFDFEKYKGLSNQEVEVNRSKYGENLLTPPKRDPWWKLFFEKFNDPIIRILLIAAVIAVAVGLFHGSFTEGIGIIVAILLATFMSFINEYKAGREFDILNKVNDDVEVKVIRNGNVTTIPRREVVVSDLVIVEIGEEIPADGEIIESLSLTVNESSLTGELSTRKWAASVNVEAEATFPSYKLLKGTTVTEGNAFYKVTAVGDNTEIGKTAYEASIQENQPTPLTRQLEKLSKLIGVIGFSVAGLAFWAFLANDLVKGKLSFTLSQWFVLFSILLPILILLIRVWLPVVYDFFALVGKSREYPGILKRPFSKLWYKQLFLAVVAFLAVAGTAYLSGINIFNSESWFRIEEIELLIQYFMVSITLIVVAVPEGLAMSVTLSLAYSMRKMTANNNLVRRMQATETMGAATVICTDKTGTLTRNEMRVMESHFFTGEISDEFNVASSLIHKSLAVNASAHLDVNGSVAKPIGNPTEGALLLWLHENGIDYKKLRSAFETKSQIAFNSENKYMATAGFSNISGRWLILLKGAPEVIVEKCKSMLTHKGMVSISKFEEEYGQTLKQAQGKGMRTIAFAYAELDEEITLGEDITQMLDNSVLIGFVGIADPVRDDVKDAVTECREAGIGIKVVTGDTIVTAREICRQIGLCNAENTNNQFLSGKEFAKLSDEDASKIVGNIRVLYRARPTDKLKLVRLLQEKDEVVAVTGDGTNDAPALNKANVGLAMGSGTSVARDASDIILLDDSFNSIVSAVRWGRSLYSNIQRFLYFQLVINLLALAIVLLGPLVGVSLPLTVTQMLWVNLIMDTLAALALATEPPHKEVMKQQPRKSSDFIISPSIKKSLLTTSALMFVFLMAFLKYLNIDRDISARELTIFFNVFVLLQFWNLLNARTIGTSHSAFHKLFQNRSYLIILTAILAGQIVIVQFGGSFFRTIPLSLTEWLILLISTSAVLWIGELKRLVASRMKKKY